MDTRILNAISGRLSLRAPQRDSLEALAQAIDSTGGALLDPKHDVPLLLETLKNQFPNTLTDFDGRDFPSLCFALATGVGKTRFLVAFAQLLF